MHWRFGLVVALLVLAGCSTLGTTGDTPTVTPAPVPAQTETTEPSPLPPGVTGADIVDIDRLALAHLEAIDGSAYRWDSNFTRVRFFDNETYVSYVRKVAVVETQRRYRYWTNRREAPREARFNYLGEYSLYADGTGRYTRLQMGDSYTYERLPARPARQQVARHASSAITEYLRVENVTVAAARVDGRRFYEIIGTDYAFRNGYRIRNYTARALVSPDGFVRSLNVSYWQNRDGEREHITYGFRYSRVGNATVERPDWVDERWTDGGRRVTLSEGGNEGE